MKIIRTKDYTHMSRAAANIISAQVILKPDSVLGLATGSSPIGTYRQLIEWNHKGDCDFSSVRTFNLDEYIGLNFQHSQSYRRFMFDNFFSQINIDPANSDIPNGCAANMEAECRRYDEKLRRVGGIDLQLLGLGVNGHIGFNEPSDHFPRFVHPVQLTQSTIQANSRLFDRIEDVPTQAITMGIGTIMKAKRILLVAGEEKKDIIHRALYDIITPEVPASVLQLHHDVTVITCKR